MGLYVMSRSITEMGIGGRMENGSRDSCLSVLDDQEKTLLEGKNMLVIKKDDKEEEENDGYFLDSSSSVSSIGKNSDEEIENDNDDDEEMQSSYNKGENVSFDSLQALEEALPPSCRKGMSRFYDGHSKSFTCLADASSYSSIREISKAEDIYSKRRKNSFARSLMVNKHNSSPLKISGGISKRSSNTRRSTLALAVAMTNSSKNSDMEEDQDSSPSSYSSLPPHYSQIRQSKFNSSCCTASFADLEQCASLKTSAPL